MRKGLLLVAGGLVVLAALGFAFYGLLAALKAQGGFWHEAWRVFFGTPPTLYRSLMGFGVVAVALCLLLSPLALAETRSLRAFARLEEEFRRAHPDAVMLPYSGEEGEGVVFDGPDGRTILLRPLHGIGQPRLVVVAAREWPDREGS